MSVVHLERRERINGKLFIQKSITMCGYAVSKPSVGNFDRFGDVTCKQCLAWIEKHNGETIYELQRKAKQ